MKTSPSSEKDLCMSFSILVLKRPFGFAPSALIMPVFVCGSCRQWDVKVSSVDSPSSTSLIGSQSCTDDRSLLSTPPVRVKKQKLRASLQNIAGGAAGPTPPKQTGFAALYAACIMLSLCSLQSSTLLLLQHNRCRFKLLFWLIVPASKSPSGFM